MWFAYIDESKEQNSVFIYSALILRGERWPTVFSAVRDFRRRLRKDYGIFLSQELHAWKFASGKGQIADRPLSKSQRAAIFREVLVFVAGCGKFRLFASINSNELYAFERLVNRINRTAEAHGEHVLLFCDEGQEVEFTRRIRRMRIHNPIPSNRGGWQESDTPTRNIPVTRIVEDPIFKDSKDSYFIQLVDFCSYALLRMERPIPSRSILGYDDMFKLLEHRAFN
ncbi:DUF3800 domain-containing protein [Aestuariivirga sp.]|uniref:DUF3800 domain-containing protein n=1 Tax=Aestuariivirga sp. TaxID=2650926 RepID=UPI0025BFDDA6|nr:DUF3800 domain-containing protein [Aestuariivirga sp.]MCA3555603.1 DUF3800 domain-containing protein [Aestuariivirga sp.]